MELSRSFVVAFVDFLARFFSRRWMLDATD